MRKLIALLLLYLSCVFFAADVRATAIPVTGAGNQIHDTNAVEASKQQVNVDIHNQNSIREGHNVVDNVVNTDSAAADHSNAVSDAQPAESTQVDNSIATHTEADGQNNANADPATAPSESAGTGAVANSDTSTSETVPSDNNVYINIDTKQPSETDGASMNPPTDTIVIDGADTDIAAGPADSAVAGKSDRPAADVDPLDIFVDGIKYKRFPKPMSMETFKSKVLNKSFKKLYILEESETKLFQNVRQLAVMYSLQNDTLYATYQFRSIYYRQCRVIPNFRMGTLGKDKDGATFEKVLPNGDTERLFIFSDNPDDYVYFLSCTDMNTSPYACRDRYYLTLDTTRDPPNQFPWLRAAEELKSKMNMTFDDPRFMFNMVMLPCAKMTVSMN